MNASPSPRLSRTFCSARDRNIPVLARTAPDSADSGQMELVSCLDYGFRCTGWLCPLFSLPTLPPESLLEEAIEVERKRRARSIRDGKAILERALREGRAKRVEDEGRARRIEEAARAKRVEEAARREAARREAAKHRERQEGTRLADPKERA